MSKIRERRVLMELKRLNKDKESGELPPGWEVCPKSDDDLYVWKAVIPGARDTPYEYGLFELEIKIGEKYPMKHPECKFVTPIYHPNVSLGDGCICVDILGSAWSPANSIKTLLISLQLLMQDPEPDDPMESQIAHLYKSDRDQFNKNCKDHIKENGILNPNFPMEEEEKEKEAEKPAETETETVAETETQTVIETVIETVTEAVDETAVPAPELVENVTTQAEAPVETETAPIEAETEAPASSGQPAPVLRSPSIQRSSSQVQPRALSRRQSSVLEMLEQHSTEIEENLQALNIEESPSLEIPAATATADLEVTNTTNTNTSEVEETN